MGWNGMKSDGMEWVDLTQDGDQWMALVNSATKLRVPQNAGKCLSSCITGGSSRSARLHECDMYYTFTS
jgi:hypothetical protein